MHNYNISTFINHFVALPSPPHLNKILEDLSCRRLDKQHLQRSTSNTQVITNALANYAKITGVDISKNPFDATIEQSNSPEAVLKLLQE